MSTNSATFDPMAQYARLAERVENQGKDIVDLRSNMNTGFTNVNANISALANDFRGAGKTQWPIIIGFCTVSITILGGLGYLALQPIKDNIAQICEDAKLSSSGTAASLSTIVDKMVTQKEMEWRTARGAEDRARMEASVKEVRDAQVPRAELERIWTSEAQQNAQMQKQIDELKASQANTYSARDLLLDMRERQDRLERQIYGSRPGQ